MLSSLASHEFTRRIVRVSNSAYVGRFPWRSAIVSGRKIADTGSRRFIVRVISLKANT